MALHSQPLPLADTKVVPAGRVSVTLVATAGLGPALLTEMTYPMVAPAITGSAISVLVTVRSAPSSMVVVWLAVLLALLVSLDVVETLAAIGKVAPVAAVVRTTTSTEVTGPPRPSPVILPSAQLTTPGVAPLWVQAGLLVEMKVVVAGSGTLKTTLLAVSALLLTIDRL